MNIKQVLEMTAFALLLSTSGIVWAESNCNVQVDCASHVMTVLGQPSRIDCGGPWDQTVNGSGTIGGLHNGPHVHDGVEITNFPGMGASGGGKVFHCTRNQPKGLNDSSGCIHVHCPDVLNQLKSCQGSTLLISGAGENSHAPSASQLAIMNTVNQQYYGTNDNFVPQGTPVNMGGGNAGGDPLGELINGLINASGASQ